MALINCSECGKKVSDKAPACPSCGNPIAIASVEPVVRTQTQISMVEYTGKKWKGIMFVAVCLSILGFLMFVGGMGSNNGGQSGLGFLFLFVGIVLAIVGKVGAWWNHG